MTYVKALGIKFIVIAITVFSIFGIFEYANLINLFWISLLVTGVSFVIGDLFILPRFGNVVASIADFGLAFLSLLVIGYLFLAEGIPIITLSVLAALFITCCEPFIHAYLIERDSKREERTNRNIPTSSRLQTEFAEEMDPKTVTDKGNKDK